MYLVAEIGVNHNGCPETAELLIREAAGSGASAVKFQHFEAQKLALAHTPKVAYQKVTSREDESHQEMLAKLQITGDIERRAISVCSELGLEFISTPYDPESAKHLVDIGCDYIKTASADVVDHRIHKVIAEANVQAVIALGMATFEEIDDMLQIYDNCSRRPILLHCVSNYPCSYDSLNLRVITELQKRYECEIGFSDHSVDENAAIIAYVLGCRFFEKHFTLDKNAEGPDHQASSTPLEFRHLYEALLRTEKILGQPQKVVQPEEENMRLVSRKSIHAIENIYKGEMFTEKNITMIRPGGGLSGSFYDAVLTRKATKNILKGDQISLEDIK